MSVPCKLISFFSLFVLIPCISTSQISQRSSNTELISAISGAMLYLEDTQLRYRNTFHTNTFNPGEEKMGNTKYFYLAKFEPVSTDNIFPNNKTGIWESEIHIVPKKFKLGKKSLLIVPDFNLFINSFIAFPFYLFKEDRHSPGYITQIKYNTTKQIRSFKRGNSYNFWMELPGRNSSVPRQGHPISL